MGRHHEFTAAADMPVYFCDPASPWQRGSNENTNGLLRQYFPKGANLASHTRAHLDAVAANSTADHAKRSAGTPQLSASQSCWRQPVDHCDATTAGMRLSAVGGVTRVASPPTT
jgi:hypothetical protein